MTAAHADAVAKKYKTGSQSSGTKAGTINAEDITAPSFPAVEVSCHQPAVDLSSSQEDEEKVQLIKLLEQERNLRLQLQYEGLVKDQRINTLENQVLALNSHNTVLVKQNEENQYQINSLKHQVNTMGQQIANLLNQVGQLIGQYNDLHFIHGHLTVHAYNLQEALKRIAEAETEQTEEKVVPFVRKGSEQESKQWQAGR